MSPEEFAKKYGGGPKPASDAIAKFHAKYTTPQTYLGTSYDPLSQPKADKLSFLQKAGVAMSAPFYALLNAPTEATQPGPSFATRVLSNPKATLMQKLETIQQGYDPFSQSQIQHAQNEPGREGEANRAILAPWKNPVVKGVNQFLVDWNNPFYKATEAMHIPGMVGNLALRNPAIAKAYAPIGKGVEAVRAPIARTFNRFYDYSKQFGERATGMVRATLGDIGPGAGGKAFQSVMSIFSPTGKAGFLARTKDQALSGVSNAVKQAIVLASQGKDWSKLLPPLELPKGWTAQTIADRGKQLREVIQQTTS